VVACYFFDSGVLTAMRPNKKGGHDCRTSVVMRELLTDQAEDRYQQDERHF